MLRFRHAKKQFLLACILILLLISLSIQPIAAQGGAGSYGLAAVGHLGYGVQAVAALPDGLLLAEGTALLRLNLDHQPSGQIALERGDIQDLVISGWRAYVLTESGLAVVDAQTMTVLAFYPGGGQALELSAGRVYVAAQQAGLRSAVLNGETGLPEGWQVITTPGEAVALAANESGGVLYVALGQAGIGVYSLDRPPALLNTLNTDGPAETLQVSAGRLWVGSDHRLYSFDLTTPTTPQLHDSYDPLRRANNLLLRGEWVYVADPAGGLKRYSIADLNAPHYEQVAWPGTIYDVSDDGRFLLLAAGWDGAVILDVDSRITLQTRGRLVLPGEATAIAVEETEDQRRAVIGLGEAGVAVTDWRDPDAPRLTAIFQPGGVVHDVALRANIGFAAVEGVGLVIFSISDPASPRQLATVPLAGTPRGLALSGSAVYVAADSGGLAIIDVLRPATPATIGTIPAPRPDQPILHVALEGKRAYLSSGHMLLVADVDVPSEAQILAAVDMPAAAAIARDFIVYTVGGPALTVLNAASSNAPRILGAYRAADSISDILVDGSAIWLAGTGDGAAAVRLNLQADGSLAEAATLGLASDGGGKWVPGLGSRPLLAAGSDGLQQVEGDHLRTLWQSAPSVAHLATTAEGQVIMADERLGLLSLDASGQPVINALAAASSPAESITAANGAIFTASSAGIARDVPVGDVLQFTQRWLPDAAEGTIQHLAAADSWLYALGAQEGGAGRLHILTTDSLFPLVTLPLPGTPQAFAYRDGYLYTAYAAEDNSGGLAVINVQHPTAGLQSRRTLPIPAADMILSADGQHGYAVQGGAIITFDLSHWPDLALLHSETLPLAAERLLLSPDEGRLLALDPGQGLLVLDLGDDGRLFPVAALTTPARDFALQQNMLYLAAGDGGLLRVSMDTLNDLSGRLALVDSTPTSALWRSGDTLYAAGRGTLRAYALAGSDVLLLASLPLDLAESAITALTGRGTRRDGYWLYLSTPGGVLTAQHRPDNSLLQAAPLPVAAGTVALAADLDHVYLRLPPGNLGVLLPGLMTETGGTAAQFAYPLGGDAGPPQTILASGQRVLVGTETGITTLEWGSSAAQLPLLAGQVEGLPGQPGDVAVSARRVYVAAGDQLWQFARDAPDVLRPLPVAAIAGGAARLALSPDGQQLAVLTQHCGLRVYDASGEALQETGRWDAPDLRDVAALDGFFVLASGEGIATLRGAPEVTASLPQPQQPDPANNATVTASSVTLRWLPEPDACQPYLYEVWAANGDDPLAPRLTGDQNEAVLNDLPQDTVIRWQVRVVAAQGRSISGPEWRFSSGDGAASVPPLAVMSRERVTPPTPTAIPPEAVAAPPAAGDAFPLDWVVLGLVGSLGLLFWVWVWDIRRRRRRYWHNKKRHT